jgi:hypothetical protein
MRNRLTTLFAAFAFAGAVFARAEPAGITTTGTLVSKSADSLVVRIDDHGHRITFGIGRETVLPDGLVAGHRVSVVYHSTGSTGQTADNVTLIDSGQPKLRHPVKKGGARPSSKGASS